METKRSDRYLEATHLVPAGETRTFAELAALAGRPGAARAAGRAIAACPVGADPPWHRIVASDGSLSTDPARERVQRKRLVAEGALPPDAKKVPPRPPAAKEPPRPSARPRARRRSATASGVGIDARLAAIDWTGADEALRTEGAFTAPGLLTPEECGEIIAAAGEDARFERTIQMGPRGYGVGTYRYWKEPIPEPAGRVRAELYLRLRQLAARVPGASDYPQRLEEFWRACRAHGQSRASSIILRYPEGGVNFPHRDIYGKVWFPFQALCLLSRRGADFEGGEFILLEEEAGRSPCERVFALDQGDLCIFASRGTTRIRGGSSRAVAWRHGMRPVTRGERFALGLVLHLAE